MCINMSAGAEEQYVTRFENRAKLTYTPRIQMVEKTFIRRSWNPFRPATTTQRKLVPVVSWTPTRTNETVPFPQRVAIKNPRLIAQVEERQSSGVKPIGGAPTRNFQTQPIVDSVPKGEYGGVQHFDRNAPKYGMKLRDSR